MTKMRTGPPSVGPARCCAEVHAREPHITASASRMPRLRVKRFGRTYRPDRRICHEAVYPRTLARRHASDEALAEVDGRFAIIPVTFQPELSHTDFPWLWDERRDSRIGLLPRNGDVSRIQWFGAPRCFAFHFANAYDDGDLTISDLPKHPRMFLTDQNGPNEGAPILVRWTLYRPSGRLTETVIHDRGDEFPRINGRYGGQAYRYVYSAHWGNDVAFGAAMKHDMQRQTTEVHDYGQGRMTAEPVFAEAGSHRRGRRLGPVLCIRPGTRPQRCRHSRCPGLRRGTGRDHQSACSRAVRFPRGWAPDKITVVE